MWRTLLHIANDRVCCRTQHGVPKQGLYEQNQAEKIVQTAFYMGVAASRRWLLAV
jgi:hypothetical protein